MYTFEIEYINEYGHIEYSFVIADATEKQAIDAATAYKSLHHGCNTEIICFETKKRIYA